jgi:hypothetical protein
MRSYAFSRKDGNHTTLADVYLELGCSVSDTSALGAGFPDAVVGCAGITDVVEFKMPEGSLEPSQKTFIDKWRGSKVWVIQDRDSVIAHVGHMRKRARKL